MIYILSIDQSTSGTKALLFDERGILIGRSDLPHEQKVSLNGWVAQDPMEIYRNTIQVVRNVLAKTGIDKNKIISVGISNQRETAIVWDRDTGLPVHDAVVWQCSRGKAICERLNHSGFAEQVQSKTGLRLSPYFSAAKIAWVLENTGSLAGKHLCAGTMDSWLIFKLTGGKVFRTDYSNASRTQLFNITELKWDTSLCAAFGLDPIMLPEVCDSDSLFGETDFEGCFDCAIPIHSVLGDSHGALFGQGCLSPGMIKTTYGTGSSVMLNTGKKPIFSRSGIVTSIAWCTGGVVNYVLEGNINYAGAVIKWIADGLGLLSSIGESGSVAASANPDDTTYLVPAFTGLGAPYWDSDAKALFYGMTRNTGRAELVKAAEECIAYQITDIVECMRRDCDMQPTELRVDGGSTRDSYLMQFQSDMLGIPVSVPDIEELSGMGAAYAAGIALGVYDKSIFSYMKRRFFSPQMGASVREKRYEGWKKAVFLATLPG